MDRDLVDRARRWAELRAAVHHAPIALFAIDVDGTIRVSEGAALGAIGVASGELVGRDVFALYGDHPTIPGYLRRGFAGEELSYNVELGDAILDTWISPVRGDTGEVTGIIGVCTDITERAHLAARVIEGDRYRAAATLAAGVAHEINNPLAFVALALANIQRELLGLGAGTPDAPAREELAARIEEMLEPALEGLGRIEATTRQLLALSVPSPEPSAPQDLGEAVRGALALAQSYVESRARLVLDLEPVPPVLACSQRLVQVCLNLLLNAAEALPSEEPSRHTVTIRTRAEAGAVVLEVLDTGPGVPAEQRDEIFQPFVTDRPDGAGTGLGLFVSRNIARSAGGDLTVDDAPGGGALFRLELPSRS